MDARDVTRMMVARRVSGILRTNAAFREGLAFTAPDGSHP
jgi:hypothetical protein